MNELPKFTINNEDIARFNDDGVICLRNAIDAKWLNHLKLAAKDLESNPSTRSNTLWHQFTHHQYQLDVLYRLGNIPTQTPV